MSLKLFQMENGRVGTIGLAATETVKTMYKLLSEPGSVNIPAVQLKAMILGIWRKVSRDKQLCFALISVL